MHYRRQKIRGGSYFFTVNVADRSSSLLIDNINILRSSFQIIKLHHPFRIDAIVVLPDHLHTIWTLPPNDLDYSKRWMLIKGEFSRKIPKGEYQRKSRIEKGERGLWQRRYWEHTIRNENDYNRHIEYIHFNPVKHGFVNRACDWEYSSIHKYVRMGILEKEWGAKLPAEYGDGFGER